MGPTPLPFGISEFTTWPLTFEEDLRLYKAEGVEYIEVCEGKLDAANPDAQLEKLKETGLKVSSVQPRLHSLYPDPPRPEPKSPVERMARLKNSIQLFGKHFPGTTLVTISGGAPNGDYALAYRTAAKEYKEVAKMAGDHGVRVALEPINPIHMNMDTFLCSIPHAMRVINEVDHPSFGLFVDVWHIWEDTGAAEQIRKYGSQIFGVHIDDWNGHQHKAQFARVDFDPRTKAGYSLSVASAGSAAMQSRYNPIGNSYNRIRIHENGRIEVENLFYGAEAAPDPGENSRRINKFQEPVSAVKQRAFARARERHLLQCDRWYREFEVTDHGDLKVSHAVEQLGRSGSDPNYLRRPHDLFHAPQGRLVEAELGLDEKAARNGYDIELMDAPASHERRCWVTLPAPPCDGTFANYTLRQGYANTLIMTRWEALERWRCTHGPTPPQGDWDEEWVGTRVTHPVRELTLRLRFPDSLRSVKPYLECRRHPEFPKYKIDEQTRDAIMVPPELTSQDQEIRDYEDDRLRYDPLHRAWELTVPEPIVGYNYQLRWKLPPDTIDSAIQARVVSQQRQLLAATDRTRQQAAWGAFDAFRESFEELLRDKSDPGEKRGFELFVYDRATLKLVPAFSYRSWTPGPLPPSFRIALGGGIAGTAFQQRRIVPWSSLTQASPFILPVPYPDVPGEEPMDLKTMVAFPVYHPAAGDGRPPPWSAIGTVSFSSSSEASMVASMFTAQPDTATRRLIITANELAQSMAQSIFERLVKS